MCDKIKEPSECSEKELEDFRKLVLKGKQVETLGLRERIRNKGKLLAFHYEKGLLVGVVGLKQPIEEYKRWVFREAGVIEDVDNFDLEIGWAFTEKEYRGQGICPRLIQKVFKLSKSKKFFATAHTDNVSVNRVLQKTGFKKIGKRYLGRKNKACQLFVRTS